MRSYLSGSAGRIVAAVVAAFSMLLAFGAQFALATGPEYSKLTEGVTTEFDVIIPIVLAALGLLIGITFAIRWATRKFGGIH